VDHTPAEEIGWTPAGTEHFTGDVWFGQLSKVADPGLDALGVLFSPGARTDWHTHPDGQVLYIASGAGKVQKDDGETVQVSSGDVVYSPAGEVHWHGASDNSYMINLSLTTGGPTNWLPDKVSDEDFRKA
jgi:quercetin dioxygenase-like cupin family protein